MNLSASPSYDPNRFGFVFVGRGTVAYHFASQLVEGCCCFPSSNNQEMKQTQQRSWNVCIRWQREMMSNEDDGGGWVSEWVGSLGWRWRVEWPWEGQISLECKTNSYYKSLTKIWKRWSFPFIFIFEIYSKPVVHESCRVPGKQVPVSFKLMARHGYGYFHNCFD